jgi:hypothetical protein
MSAHDPDPNSPNNLPRNRVSFSKVEPTQMQILLKVLELAKANAYLDQESAGYSGRHYNGTEDIVASACLDGIHGRIPASLVKYREQAILAFAREGDPEEYRQYLALRKKFEGE